MANFPKYKSLLKYLLKIINFHLLYHNLSKYKPRLFRCHLEKSRGHPNTENSLFFFADTTFFPACVQLDLDMSVNVCLPPVCLRRDFYNRNKRSTRSYLYRLKYATESLKMLQK